MSKIKIVEVNDVYIDYMKKYFYGTIMDNKKLARTHTRKYIGIVLKMNGFNYFAPLSSPKSSDFLNDGNIRKSSSIVIRMVENKKDGSKKLLGTIKLNNMIPVPDREIINYNINNEEDIKYKNIVLNELLWLEKNTTAILSAAKHLYNLKSREKENINDKNLKFYKSITPFKEAEKKCLNFYNNN